MPGNRSRSSLKREINSIYRGMRQYQREVGEEVLWYEYDETDSTSNATYDEGPSRKWFAPKVVPVMFFHFMEDTSESTEYGRYLVNEANFTISVDELIKAGVTDPLNTDKHFSDRFAYNGNIYKILEYQPQGFVHNTYLTISVRGTQVKDEENQLDLNPYRTLGPPQTPISFVTLDPSGHVPLNEIAGLTDDQIDPNANIQQSKIANLPTILGLAEYLSNKNKPGGYSGLDNTGHLLLSQLPPVAPKIVTANYTCQSVDSVILADATGQQPPVAVMATPVASGGIFAARAQPQGYYWAVTAVGPNGESAALPAGAAQPIVHNGSAVINWQAAPGATAYNLYRSVFTTNQYPPVGALGLVASNIFGTSYIDTGTATTSGTPPTTNGAAFTITLPDATQYVGILRLRAIGNTPNLVTVQSVSGQQIGTLGTSITLGQVFGATYQGVELVSDGANWRIVSFIPLPLWNVHGMGLNAGTITPAQSWVPVAVIAVPRLGFGQRLTVRASTNLLPATGATIFYPGLYWCTAAGGIQNYNAGLAGTLNGSQLGYWQMQNFSPGEYAVVSGLWGYNPRPGDYSAEGGGWGGYDGYLGLFIITVGGNCQAFSSAIDVIGGAVDAEYFGGH